MVRETSRGAKGVDTVETIISGGQTGADRGALDAAIALGLPHGGACPAGRRAEDGRIPDRYAMTELASRDYAARTEQNVVDSCGTAIISWGPLTGGSALTRELAVRHGRPWVHLPLRSRAISEAARELRAFCAAHRIRTLNIAGPRESNAPGIHDAVVRVISAAMQNDHAAPSPNDT